MLFIKHIGLIHQNHVQRNLPNIMNSMRQQEKRATWSQFESIPLGSNSKKANRLEERLNVDWGNDLSISISIWCARPRNYCCRTHPCTIEFTRMLHWLSLFYKKLLIKKKNHKIHTITKTYVATVHKNTMKMEGERTHASVNLITIKHLHCRLTFNYTLLSILSVASHPFSLLQVVCSSPSSQTSHTHTHRCDVPKTPKLCPVTSFIHHYDKDRSFRHPPQLNKTDKTG